jgi:putative MATE family efflux protein
MAVPMLAGTFAMTAYNLTDTWFVSRLGTLPLAAMGFTFPVVMLLTCVAGGIGTGVTTLVSHAIGRRTHHDAAQVVTHGILLVLCVAATIAVAGYFSIDAIFGRLGADAQTLPLVGEYMRTWYLGALFMSLPMMGNGVLISAGDSRSASRFMILGTVLNAILDPIMIFGYLGCPAMGMRGAALATVIAQAVSTVWLFLLLYKKHRLLLLGNGMLAGCLGSFRKIAGFAVPSILSMVLMPISATVITRLLGSFGNEAVAAAGACGRIEMFAFVIPMALGISLTPFVSQNFGANRLDRIREAMTMATRFALLYGGAVAIVFFICAPWIAAVFSQDLRVVAIMVSYIRIISFGYGMMEVHRYCGFYLTGRHRPFSTTLLNAIRVLVWLIPLSCLGSHVWGVRGVFLARLLTDLSAGTIGLLWIGRTWRPVP